MMHRTPDISPVISSLAPSVYRPRWSIRLPVYQLVVTTVKRKVYEALGSYYGRNLGEGLEMRVCAVHHLPIDYIPSSLLAGYRMHSCSISGTGYMVGELPRALMLIQEHLLEKARKVPGVSQKGTMTTKEDAGINCTAGKL